MQSTMKLESARCEPIKRKLRCSEISPSSIITFSLLNVWTMIRLLIPQRISVRSFGKNIAKLHAKAFVVQHCWILAQRRFYSGFWFLSFHFNVVQSAFETKWIKKFMEFMHSMWSSENCAMLSLSSISRFLNLSAASFKTSIALFRIWNSINFPLMESHHLVCERRFKVPQSLWGLYYS